MSFEDLISFLQENKSVFLAILASVQIILACVESILLFIVTRSMRRYLDAARNRGTFTVCPHCGSEVKLSNLEFRLPDGSIDNDLNGKPD